jgi:integrase
MEDSFDSMTAAQVKAAVLSGKHKKTKVHYLSELFNEYMQMDLSEGTKDIYKTTLDKIIRFAGSNVTIEQVDLRWLYQFDKFLSNTLSVNSRAIYLRHLRAVCHYAYRTKRTDNHAFDDFTIKKKETKKLAIKVDVLRKFYSCKTNYYNNRYRDYFFLQFFLIGINIVDLVTAKKEQVVDGRFYYARCKTHKLYSVKIEPEAKVLLDKYSGKNWLVEAHDRYADYKNFRKDMNDALKTIGTVTEETVFDSLFSEPRTVTSVKPIIPKITTNYARHTWATIAAEIGIPIDVISQAFGHSMVNRTTLIYIKFDQKKVDEANRKVIDYFFSKY